MQQEDAFTEEDRQFMMLAFDEVCVKPVTNALNATRIRGRQLMRASHSF